MARTRHSVSGDSAKASENASKLLPQSKARLAVYPGDRDAQYYAAFANRVLGNKNEAYELLRRLFPGTLGELSYALTLGRADPSLEVFAPDSEFQDLLKDLDKRDTEIRARIAETEKSFSQ
jgi:hypothetical protein